MTSNEQDWIFGGPDTEVDVLLEPTTGHTVDEIVRRLHEEGASNVTVLSPGFVSARATHHALRSLDSIAIAHPKPTKGLRRPR